MIRPSEVTFSAELSRVRYKEVFPNDLFARCHFLSSLSPGNKEDEFSMRTFKRLAAVVSLSLVLSIAIIPCAVFFFSVQTVSGATTAGITEQNNGISVITKTYNDDQVLYQKHSAEAATRAKAFDTAKKNADKTLAQLDNESALDTVNAVSTSAKASYTVSTNSKYLLDISNADPNYVGHVVKLDSYDRDILERLVMGEAGGEGFIGACLVAQAIRDTMINDGYSSVEAVRTSCGYSGSVYTTPNQDVLDAVKFIFDEGGSAVQHDIIYFYAPSICFSGFHESQEFVVEYNSHRFFDRW